MNRKSLSAMLRGVKTKMCQLYADDCKHCPSHGPFCCALTYVIRAIEWMDEEEKESDT